MSFGRAFWNIVLTSNRQPQTPYCMTCNSFITLVMYNLHNLSGIMKVANIFFILAICFDIRYSITTRLHHKLIQIKIPYVIFAGDYSFT